MKARLLLSGLALLLAATFAKPAFAWVHVCNKTTAKIWVSYADHGECHGLGNLNCGTNRCGGSDWEASWHHKGWFTANPGACTTPNGGDADDFAHQIYSENAAGVWWGDYDGMYLCTPNTAFDRCTDEVRGDYSCPASEGRGLWHRAWWPSNSDWTLNIRP